MALAEFRHTLDFFSTYFDDTVYDSPSAHSVRALKVISPLKYRLYGPATFTEVWIDREFLFGWKAISDLALLLLGLEVWVCPVKETAMERQSGGGIHVLDIEGNGNGSWENSYLRVLTRNMDDVYGKLWGEGMGSNTRGGAILLRADGGDLDTDLAEMMCRYSVDVLEPRLERALRGEVPRSSVLAEASQEKMRAWATSRPSSHL